MKIGDKLALMKEINRRNDERWSITSKEQGDRQTAVEYSAREAMMALYIRQQTARPWALYAGKEVFHGKKNMAGLPDGGHRI